MQLQLWFFSVNFEYGNESITKLNTHSWRWPCAHSFFTITTKRIILNCKIVDVEKKERIWNEEISDNKKMNEKKEETKEGESNKRVEYSRCDRLLKRPRTFWTRLQWYKEQQPIFDSVDCFYEMKIEENRSMYTYMLYICIDEEKNQPRFISCLRKKNNLKN